MVFGLVSLACFTVNSSGTLLVAFYVTLVAYSESNYIFLCFCVNPITRPTPNSAIFITLIVKFPVIQSSAMILGLFLIALEFPLSQLKPWAIYRSLVVRIVLLLFQVFFGILYYQVSNRATRFPCQPNGPVSRVQTLQSGL